MWRFAAKGHLQITKSCKKDTIYLKNKMHLKGPEHFEIMGKNYLILFCIKFKHLRISYSLSGWNIHKITVVRAVKFEPRHPPTLN